MGGVQLHLLLDSLEASWLYPEDSFTAQEQQAYDTCRLGSTTVLRKYHSNIIETSFHQLASVPFSCCGDVWAVGNRWISVVLAFSVEAIEATFWLHVPDIPADSHIPRVVNIIQSLCTIASDYFFCSQRRASLCFHLRVMNGKERG